MTAVLALVLCLVLPGLAGGVLVSRLDAEPAHPGVFLTRFLAIGTSVWLLLSGSVALTVGITRTSSWVSEAMIAFASVVVLVPPRSRRVLRAAAGDAGYLLGILGVLAVSWLPIAVLIVRTSWAPLGSTPWYYWSLAQQVANHGHVPATTTEWGVTLPFLDDYHLFTTGSAMLVAQGGSLDASAVHVVTMLSAILLACGSALLARSLGAPAWASLAAVPFAVATGIGAVRITSYRPEALALGLTLLVAAAFADWFRRGDRGALISGCLLGAVLSQVHGIAFLASALLVVAAAVSTATRGRAHLRAVLFSAVLLIGFTLVLTAVLGGVSGATSSNDLHGSSGLADQTWQFFRGIRGKEPSQPPGNGAIVHAGLHVVYESSALWVAVSVCLAAVVLGVTAVRGDRTARRTAVFTAVSLIGMGLVGAAFAFGWSSYVPRRTGSQRLVQEATLLVGPFVGVAVGRLPLGRRQEWGKALVGSTLVVLAVVGFFASLRYEDIVAQQRPHAHDVRALAQLGMPKNAVVLTNAYTEGYLRQVAQVAGLLEGRAPYTYPRVLARANRLLRESKAFYSDPQKHADFLTRNHVDYVVVSRPGSYSLGTTNLIAGARSAAAIERLPGLVPVHRSQDLMIFEVRPPAIG